MKNVTATERTHVRDLWTAHQLENRAGKEYINTVIQQGAGFKCAENQIEGETEGKYQQCVSQNFIQREQIKEKE